MLALGFWSWALLGVLSVVVLAWSANRSFRRSIRREFMAYLAETLPGAQVLRETGSSLLVRLPEMPEGEITSNLHNLYAHAARLKPDTPEARRELYRQHLAALTEHVRRSTAPLSLEAEAVHIRPRLMTDAALAAFSGQEQGELPRTPVPGLGLSVVYVLDGEASVMYLTRPHVADLGLDVASIHQRALDNLRPTLPEEAVRNVLEGGRMNLLKLGDTYDAARLLLVPSLLREGEAIAAVVPDRDTLALAPVPADGDWKSFARLSRSRDHATPLLDRPVKVTPAGFELM